MRRAALLSVSNRAGLESFSRGLLDLGFELLATSGTGAALKEAGIAFTAIESYTGQEEILDGRVKTLHPKIHAGLLAKRSDPAHREELERRGILAIDVAAVNLYPFVKNLDKDAAKNPAAMIELVDVGGPAMLRASAKNFSSVYVVIDPNDYDATLKNLKEEGGAALQFRKDLAVKVFSETAAYDLEIAKYFSGVHSEGSTLIAPPPANEPGVSGLVGIKAQELRYGENPNQSAAFYLRSGVSAPGWTLLNGKELSYNNLLDLDASLALMRIFSGDKPFAAIIKHLNPCGAAYGKSPRDALISAKKSDPRSHFGGIIVFNRELDAESAEEVRGDFAEIVAAPGFSSEALSILKTSKNLRVILAHKDIKPAEEWRSAAGGFVKQSPDLIISSVRDAKLAAGRAVNESLMADLELAWKLCARTKSNAITIVKDGVLLGSGAGQMSRIDSVELAISKARRHGHDLRGAAAASDAFFPFADNIEALAEAGVAAVVAPSGAKRDPEVAAAAEAKGVSLYFAQDRHFYH